MDPITGAAMIGAGSSLLGGIGSMFGQKRANAANRDLFIMQREANLDDQYWGHYRQQKALKFAGLNPMLAYSQQPGAQNMNAPQMENEMEGTQAAVEGAANTALATKRLGEEIKQIQEATKKIKSDKVLADKQAFTEQAKAHYYINQGNSAGASTQRNDYINKMLELPAYGAHSLTKAKNKVRDYLKKNEDFGKPYENKKPSEYRKDLP